MSSSWRRIAPSVLLGSILAIATILRFWGLAFGLPNPETRPDETTTVAIAIALTYAGLNPRFFHWPSLEFYVVAAIYRVWYIYGHRQGWYHIKYDMFRAAAVDPTYWILVPRALSAAAGVATVWLVYRFTRDVFDRMTALVAAFFAAVAFLHVRDSHFGVTDVPMTFLAMAAMLPLSRLLVDPGRRRDWIAAGILTGLAASTKYNGGIMAATGVAVAVMGLVTGSDEDRRKMVLRGLAGFAVASALAFVAGTPFSVLDTSHFIDGLLFDSEHLMFGQGVPLGRGWRYHLIFSLWYGLGPPLLLAAIVGIFAVAWHMPRKAVLLCTFPIVYYLLVGRGTTVFVRYVTPLVPFLCIIAAVTVVRLARLIAVHTGWNGSALAATIALLLAVPSVQRAIAFDRLITQTDTRVLARSWIDAHAQPSDWIAEEQPALLHSNFASPAGLRVATFNPHVNAFVSVQSERAVTPDWIVLPRAPVVSYMLPATRLLPIVMKDYTLAAVFEAGTGVEGPRIFDEQDMFIVPYADFSQRDRPGPDVYIYRRKGTTSNK